MTQDNNENVHRRSILGGSAFLFGSLVLGNPVSSDDSNTEGKYSSTNSETYSNGDEPAPDAGPGRVEMHEEHPDYKSEYDFYGPEWRDPPERENEAFVSDFDSFQDALSNVDENTTLFIDNGPITGSGWELEVSNVTLSGEGYDDARLIHDFEDQYMLTTDRWDLEGTPVDHVSEGDTTITGVEDTDLFTVGQNVQLIDETDRYTRDNPGTSSSTNDTAKGMIAEVTGIMPAENTVEINVPAYLNFEGDPELQHIEWGTTGIHYHDFEAHGDGRDADPDGATTDERYRLVTASRAKDVWVTNVRAYDIHGMGISIYRCLNAYTRDTLTNGCRFYGVSVSSGTTNAHVHNQTGINAARYAVQTGSGSSSTTTYYVRTYNCEGYGVAAVTDAHFGILNVVFYNNYATGDVRAHPDAEDGNSQLRDHSSSLHRLRGEDMHGVFGHSDVTTEGADITHAQQWPVMVEYRGLTSTEGVDDRYGIDLTTAAEDDDDFPIEKVVVRDCDLHGDDPFRFRAHVEDLVVENYRFNGELVEPEDIENSQNFGEHNVTYTVNNDTDSDADTDDDGQ